MNLQMQTTPRQKKLLRLLILPLKPKKLLRQLLPPLPPERPRRLQKRLLQLTLPPLPIRRLKKQPQRAMKKLQRTRLQRVLRKPGKPQKRTKKPL